ncbi:hypothetical protein Tco_1131681 [Tanacetum coccineum]|uniref:Uncharacterized protein n=1 Tax=Tanacetum coccineum TaxID=301880 RepID=A0ABQ5J9R6_9ASTR
MIGSLMYLTASRPDIMFAVCACARFQVTLKTSHLLAIKRIFRYLKGKPTLGLWYSRDSLFELVAILLSVNMHGALKIGSLLLEVVRFLGQQLISWQVGDRMERAATIASSLEAEQDNGSGPRCQDTILRDVDAQTRFETTSKESNDPPLSRGYTLRSGEDSMKLLELMELCTKLSNMLHKNRKSDLVIGLLTAVRHNFVLPVQVNAAEGDSINTSIQVNGERQIQALIDKKKVILTEISIRSDLHLEDAGGQEERGGPTVVIKLETTKDDSIGDSPSNVHLSVDAQAKEIADLKKRVQKLERKKEIKNYRIKKIKESWGEKRRKDATTRNFKETKNWKLVVKRDSEQEEVEVDDEAELKKHMVIVKDDEIAIDAIPLATKPPVIVEYKLLKEGIMVHYQLIRADGSSKRYSSMIRML